MVPKCGGIDTLMLALFCARSAAKYAGLRLMALLLCVAARSASSGSGLVGGSDQESDIAILVWLPRS